MKGGSITGHLAKLTDRYGFEGFGDAISTIADADFIAAIQGVRRSFEKCLRTVRSIRIKYF